MKSNSEIENRNEQLLHENAKLRSENVALKARLKGENQKTILLRKTLKELADFKRAIDESTVFSITNGKGKIIYVNDWFCKLSGYSKEELFGQTNRIINSGYHSQEFFKDLWRTITSGQIWRGEIKNKRKNGTLFWVDTTIVPLIDDDGHPNYYLAIRSDITKAKLITSQNEFINENKRPTKFKRAFLH